MSNTLKPCPFCGHTIDLDDPDTIYPNGTGWEDHDDIGLRSYYPRREVPKEQWCYSVHCSTNSGGCGAELSGDSRTEAIEKWNKRK